MGFTRILMGKSSASRNQKKIITNDWKAGKKIERKKIIVTTSKVKRKNKQQDEPPHRPSKYVGVSWNKKSKKWEASIKIEGKNKSLGYYHDEKEAARMYDEQAALLGRSVNFPLHEGMEQAAKPAPKGGPAWRIKKEKSKSLRDEKEEDDKEEMDEWDSDAAFDDDDEIDDAIIMDNGEQNNEQASSSSCH